MTSTGWWSQPFAPEGSVAAEGIVKQLGRPAMDPLTVLIREAAQNSWDARRPSGPVDFTIRLTRLGSLTAAWREILLPPPATQSRQLLDDYLSTDSALLIVSDRGTVGLGGPLRAGVRPDGGEKSDFVQFMRNVGEPRDHEYGGGTYGFGKGIFYQLSRVSTIVVDTRTAEATPSRRLMGAALGESYYVGDQRFTGRHWWGSLDDVVIDPVMDDEAQAICQRLGLPGFSAAETGTDIAIIAANLGTIGGEADSPTRTLNEAAVYLGSSILWNLWPKWIPDEDDRYMRFRLIVDGHGVQIPQPESVHHLQPFVEALRGVRSGDGARYARTVPPKDAGSFSLTLTSATANTASQIVDAARPFDGSPHHVARMRTPELIVDYLPGVPHSDSRLGYGAVFKASLEADAAFALSEPPTHDGWIAGGLTGRDRGVVQNVNRFISREIASRVAPPAPGRADGSGHGLGELSARLGSLIPATTTSESSDGLPRNGHQSGNGRGPTGQNAPKQGGKPRIIGVPALEIHDGSAYFVARVEIPASGTKRTIRAGIDVVIEGGKTEVNPPEGAALPSIVKWQPDELATKPVAGPVVSLPPGKRTSWRVYASYVADVVVRFRLSEATANGGRHAQ